MRSACATAAPARLRTSRSSRISPAASSRPRPRRSEPPATGAGAVPADCIARSRRGGRVHDPRQGGGGGKPRFPGGSPLPAVERPADQRGNEPLLLRHASGRTNAARSCGDECSAARGRWSSARRGTTPANDSRRRSHPASPPRIDELLPLERQGMIGFRIADADRELSAEQVFEEPPDEIRSPSVRQFRRIVMFRWAFVAR